MIKRIKMHKAIVTISLILAILTLSSPNAWPIGIMWLVNAWGFSTLIEQTWKEIKSMADTDRPE